MKICFFGSYDRNYSKNVVLLKGFKYVNIDIVHCHHPNYFTITHYPSLFLQFIRKARGCDVIFVAFFGHYDVLFAKMIGIIFRKPVVFDPLISIYNTRIEDRKYFTKSSLRASFYKLFDKFNVFLSDLVFIDTNAQIEYYTKKFSSDKNKFRVVRVGADESTLRPRPNVVGEKLKLLFYGSYQPSQGAMRIIKAAHLLKEENFEWIFVGTGQDRSKVENYAVKNKLQVSFIDTVSFPELVKYINATNIVFGVFGNTEKTKIVIHNKVFQALAMGRVLITQETAAVDEILKNGANAIITKPSEHAIAVEIKKLSADSKLIKKISTNGRKLYLENFTSRSVAMSARFELERIISSYSENHQRHQSYK